jgi:hypothetical protein
VYVDGRKPRASASQLCDVHLTTPTRINIKNKYEEIVMAQSFQTAVSEQPAHDFAEVNGVELHYAHAGDGPLIVFLHGFPQCG